MGIFGAGMWISQIGFFLLFSITWSWLIVSIHTEQLIQQSIWTDNIRALFDGKFEKPKVSLAINHSLHIPNTHHSNQTSVTTDQGNRNIRKITNQKEQGKPADLEVPIQPTKLPDSSDTKITLPATHPCNTLTAQPNSDDEDSLGYHDIEMELLEERDFDNEFGEEDTGFT